MQNNKASQYHLNNLNPSMVTIAREFRGLTKKDLAIAIGKSPAAITRIEKGDLRPDIETFFKISNELRVRPSFFSKPNSSIHSIDVSSCHFRSNRSVSLALK